MLFATPEEANNALAQGPTTLLFTDPNADPRLLTVKASVPEHMIPPGLSLGGPRPSPGKGMKLTGL